MYTRCNSSGDDRWLSIPPSIWFWLYSLRLRQNIFRSLFLFICTPCANRNVLVKHFKTMEVLLLGITACSLPLSPFCTLDPYMSWPLYVWKQDPESVLQRRCSGNLPACTFPSMLWVGERLRYSGEVTRATKLNPGSMCLPALYVVNWLPDLQVTSDRNSPLLSKALRVLWHPSFRLHSAASQFPFFWKRWDTFEVLHTIVCRALHISFHSTLNSHCHIASWKER